MTRVGFTAAPQDLDGIAAKLRGSANDLDAAASTPPAVDAGEVSTVIDGVLQLHTESMAGVVEGLGAAGDEVAGNRAAYVGTDSGAGENLGSIRPGPR